jgi:hypothetical protein
VSHQKYILFSPTSDTQCLYVPVGISYGSRLTFGETEEAHAVDEDGSELLRRIDI